MLPEPPSKSRSVFDPGWLFVLAGLGLLVATVVLPAIDELNHARWLRERALLLEQHRTQRLDRHEQYLEALRAKDPALLVSLAGTQLNQIPADREPLAGFDEERAISSSVFPALEPEPTVLPPERKVDSMLHRLATGPTTRSWMLGIGSVLVLIGLLPPGKTREDELLESSAEA